MNKERKYGMATNKSLARKKIIFFSFIYFLHPIKGVEK